MKPEDKAVMQQALKLAYLVRQKIEAAYLAGFQATGEGYNAEYPFEGRNPEDDAAWVRDRDNALCQLLERTEPVQEPDAVVTGYYGGQCVITPTDPARVFSTGTAFYTQPADHSEQHLDMVDHGDELTIAYLDGVHTGKQMKREWVGLTAKDLSEIPANCYEGAIWADAKLKEKNT